MTEKLKYLNKRLKLTFTFAFASLPTGFGKLNAVAHCGSPSNDDAYQLPIPAPIGSHQLS